MPEHTAPRICQQATQDEVRHFVYAFRKYLERFGEYGSVPDHAALGAAVTALTDLQHSLIPDDDQG